MTFSVDCVELSPMPEKQRRSNRDRFVRLAEKRVNRTVKDIRLIGNLSNRNNYSYSEKDVDRIFRTLDQELKASRARFQARPRARSAIFRLKD